MIGVMFREAVYAYLGIAVAAILVTVIFAGVFATAVLIGVK